jgi:hypothetical protein
MLINNAESFVLFLLVTAKMRSPFVVERLDGSDLPKRRLSVVAE